MNKRLTNFILLAWIISVFALAKSASARNNMRYSYFQEDTVKIDSVDKKTKKKKDLPLTPERAIEFNATEGSWISLDVSPDGKTLAFDLLGDIYTMPITGGKATRITEGMAFDGQPRFSPDGKHLVYTSDEDGGENIWILELDSKEKTQITKDKSNRYQSPEWTPDGKYIVASKTGLRSGSYKLWLYHKNGGTGAQIIKEPSNLKTVEAAFGPDGRYLWFSRRSGNWQYNARFPQYQLAIFDRQKGLIEIKTSRYGSAFRPTLSPNGRWLVYGTRHDAETGLIIRDLNTGDERWLAYPVQHDDQESRATRGVLPGMSFTPDSQFLVVSYGGKIWKLPANGGNAVEIPLDVDVDIDLGPRLEFKYPIADDAEFIVRQIRDAVPSPDSKQLVFTSLDRLYLMDYPNGQPRKLTQLDLTEAHPTWSPDGKWIAFVTWDHDGGHIYKIQASGNGSPVKLSTEPAIYSNTVWADNNRIVALRGSAQNYKDSDGPFAFGSTRDLVWVSSNGGSVNFIKKTHGLGNPHFVKGVNRIYLSGFRDGLVSIRWDGTDEKSHLKVTGVKPPDSKDPPNASMIKMAPEGDWALAVVGNNIYTVTVPVVGSETPKISVADIKKSSFPARKLTDIGGQFPAWNNNGKKIHWSMGNAHFVYDMEMAQAFEDSVKRAKKIENEKSDSDSEEGENDDEDNNDEKKDEEKYEATESRIKINATRDIPKGIVVLRGARVISMKGNEIIENADILIENNRIKSLGIKESFTIPAGAVEINVDGKTILPGFVDTHAHMWPSWGIHKTQVWPYLANLAYGVTTTRDPQTATTDVLTYGDMVTAGKMLGPRIYSTGPGIFWQEQIKSLDHARDIMKRYSDYYHTNTIKMYVAGNRQMRQWIIMAANEQKIMPTTEGSLNLKMNLTQIIDGYPGHEHNFPIFPLYSDVVKLVADSKTFYTPTLLVAYGGPFGENFYYATERPHDDSKLKFFTPHSELDRKSRRRSGWFMKEEHVIERNAAFVKDLVAADGRAGVGSHGQLQGLGYHWELWNIQSGGLSEHDALKVATIHGAEAIGLDGDIGSIEPGKLADLVILDQNPLEDIRNTNTVSQVMKNGRLYNANNLNEVYPREKKLDKLWWQKSEPVDLPGVEINKN